MRIVTTDEMRQLEQATDASGVSYAQMMESAGQAVALACQEALDVAGRSILVLVGPGNNGGDGLVAAHYLAKAGAEVVCYVWGRDVEGDLNFARGSAYWRHPTRTPGDSGRRYQVEERRDGKRPGDPFLAWAASGGCPYRIAPRDRSRRALRRQLRQWSR
jgi:hypothetical protein